MTFNATIKFFAGAADDDHNFGDDEDHDDQRTRFGDDDEEEEVTMTSDDDEELDEEEDGALQGTHAEDATIFSLPPSPVTSYEPATKPSELPVKSDSAANIEKPVRQAAKKVAYTKKV